MSGQSQETKSGQGTLSVVRKSSGIDFAAYDLVLKVATSEPGKKTVIIENGQKIGELNRNEDPR